MTTAIQTDLYNRYQFFAQHAMSSIGRNAIRALQLAKAEIWAEAHGMAFVWEWDGDGDLGDHECWCKEAARFDAGYGRYPDPQCEHEILWCRAVWQGKTQASLSGIIDTDKAYGRVVEAELACEAQDTGAQFIYY